MDSEQGDEELTEPRLSKLILSRDWLNIIDREQLQKPVPHHPGLKSVVRKENLLHLHFYISNLVNAVFIR